MDEINYYDELNKAVEMLKEPRKEFEDVRNILNNIIENVTPIIDANEKIISVNNIIEYYIFNNRFNLEKKYTVIDFPLHKAYYYIALSYINEHDNETAIKYLKKAIVFNPYDALSYFELADIYKTDKEYKKMYLTLFEGQRYFYRPEDMASFYIELGDYFFFTKNYEFANILYSYSTIFEHNGYSEKALTKIGLTLKRQLIFNKKEECIDYLTKYKFPINAKKENIDQVYELYNKTKEHPEDYLLRRELKEILYRITKNEIFEDRLTLRNQQLKFTFKIPEKWKVLDRNQFNKSSTGAYTLYVIEINKNSTINLDIVKSVSQPNLLEEYKLFRNFITNQGFNIVLENEIAAKNIKYIQMLSQRKLLNEYVTIIHCLFIINNQLLDLTVSTLNAYSDENKEQAYKDENVIRLNKIINSIEFL